MPEASTPTDPFVTGSRRQTTPNMSGSHDTLFPAEQENQTRALERSGYLMQTTLNPSGNRPGWTTNIAWPLLNPLPRHHRKAKVGGSSTHNLLCDRHFGLTGWDPNSRFVIPEGRKACSHSQFSHKVFPTLLAATAGDIVAHSPQACSWSQIPDRSSDASFYDEDFQILPSSSPVSMPNGTVVMDNFPVARIDPLEPQFPEIPPELILRSSVDSTSNTPAASETQPTPPSPSTLSDGSEIETENPQAFKPEQRRRRRWSASCWYQPVDAATMAQADTPRADEWHFDLWAHARVTNRCQRGVPTSPVVARVGHRLRYSISLMFMFAFYLSSESKWSLILHAYTTYIHTYIQKPCCWFPIHPFGSCTKR